MPSIDPATVYINWAAYDELSDQVELTEEIALRQFDELLRLRALGLRLDYYLMDAFWYAPDGGYRKWRHPHWSDNGERWLECCREHAVLPGLWFGSNAVMDFCKVAPIPEWEDSLNAARTHACFFEGNFWPYMLETYAIWYARGVRLFKIDFTGLDAATPGAERRLRPSEIWQQNLEALISGIRKFRESRPDARFIGYNGLWEKFSHPSKAQPLDLQSGTSVPSRQIVDRRLLEAFDTIYCGDPRPADVPAQNFWRSKDVYTDHMVRVFLANGLPLERIDNAGFMIGTTGTCYFRKTAAWEGMAILAYARGGALTTLYGNLDLLDAEKAKWFARVQQMFGPFIASDSVKAFGGWPGAGEPYGYVASDEGGALVTVVNPGQNFAMVPWPMVGNGGARVLFADVGFEPELTEAGVKLGPEQLAVIGRGRYADAALDLGRQTDVRIPQAITPVAADFTKIEPGRVAASVTPSAAGTWRVTLTQTGPGGFAVRSSGGAPPDGLKLNEVIWIEARQAGRTLPVSLGYDKAIWSGLSAISAEFPVVAGEPVEITGVSREKEPVELTARVYRVDYAG